MEEKNEQQEQQPLGVLFSILAYNDTEEYNEFIARLDAGVTSDTILTIYSALKYAQARGAFSEEENRAIESSLNNLNKIFETK
jgi:hypothetical protein